MRLFFILFTVILCLSCEDKEMIKKGSEEIVFTSFSVKNVSNNDIYMLDIDLKNKRINSNGLLPYEFDLTKLIITYTLNTDQSDIEVRLNGVSQISGESLNDFTEPKVYEIYRSGDLVSTFECLELNKEEEPSMVDEETPRDILPYNDNIGKNWKLDFSDEFNFNYIDDRKWNIDNSQKSRGSRPNIGVKQWFWKPYNVEVKNGNLILKVNKEAEGKMTCGSINSNKKYMLQYGYMEARIKVADINCGTHTAFWLQGPYQWKVDGTANDGAEVDIFESAWVGDYTSCVVHIDGYGKDHKANTIRFDTPNIHDDYHIWGLLWTEDCMEIYYDGVRKARYSDSKWIPRCLEYLWLSDGAAFGEKGNQYFVDRPIGFLTEAYVDYIRVWKPLLN